MQSALSPDFRYEVRPRRERVVVRMEGELDIGVAPGLARAVNELLEAGFARVTIDLRDVTFLDSAGVHMLEAARLSAAKRACVLSLVRGSHKIRRVFELTATESLLDLDEDAGVQL